MSYPYPLESVLEGCLYKIADQTFDAILNTLLASQIKVATTCEVLVATRQVILTGEVGVLTYVGLVDIRKSIIENIGYTNSDYYFEAKSYRILSSIHNQLKDINQRVGDQGLMFGYTISETDNFMCNKQI